MTGPYALILAGSGMLRDVAEQLTRDGWCVLLPCRRYSPVPVTPDGDPVGRALWIEADWDEPEELARRVAATTHGAPVDLLVDWLHESHRRPVLAAVAGLLSPTAPVVDVRPANEATGTTTLPRPEPVLGERPTQEVQLGETSGLDPERPLAHRETVAGVLNATRRALDGAPSSLHLVGERKPRPRIPRPRLHWDETITPTVPRPRVGTP